MKILVCVKQVPDTDDIKWTENNTMQREGVESIINPCDLYAIEEALKIKKIFPDAELSVLTMGPLQAEDMLKRIISLGFDRGILLSDKKFAGSDTYATAKTIAAAIKSYLNDYDLIICGQFAIDGDTAQTGPSIATQLGIPQITFVKNLERCDGKSIYAIRELEDGTETVKCDLPVLTCILNGGYETSRPTINGIKKSKDAKIEILTFENIELDESGIKASPTYVSKAFRPQHNRGECKFLTDISEVAAIMKGCANE